MALVARLATNDRLYELASSYLTASAGLSPGADPYNLEQLVKASVVADPEGSHQAAAEIYRRHEAGNFDPASLVAELIAGLTHRRFPPSAQVLRALHGLITPQIQPAILIGEPKADMNAAVNHLAQVAESVPWWDLAMTVSAEAFDQYLRTAPDSRAKSLLRSGLIDISSSSSVVAELSLPPIPGIQPNPKLTAAHAEAVRLRPQRDDAARSAAERFLFELLQSHPATRGLFVLNGHATFQFGPRLAEIDLLARALWLAVEIDGYYHFTDSEAYRRDRRKDWELQRHGYRVVRVLADDVVEQTGQVMEVVLAAVEHCSGKSDGEASSRE
jgi:hypothetical protein